MIDESQLVKLREELCNSDKMVNVFYKSDDVTMSYYIDGRDIIIQKNVIIIESGNFFFKKLLNNFVCTRSLEDINEYLIKDEDVTIILTII